MAMLAGNPQVVAASSCASDHLKRFRISSFDRFFGCQRDGSSCRTSPPIEIDCPSLYTVVVPFLPGIRMSLFSFSVDLIAGHRRESVRRECGQPFTLTV